MTEVLQTIHIQIIREIRAIRGFSSPHLFVTAFPFVFRAECDILMTV
jgi:hypothetical protein